ncbi:MAG: cellulase family glycosylhydrolase [Gemmatimonadaceae bacterium]|nr:cellulase family glycosylhydrolase [Chitinophagaceae bacterium]
MIKTSIAKSILPVVLFLSIALSGIAQKKQTKTTATQVATTGTVWSIEKANAWYASHPWLSGADFLPSTAINQLEMWQGATFDSATIDRELGWAQGLGFNTMRVYLHSLAWKQDPAGFKNRMNSFLNIATKHGITTLFVFFDDCWNKVPEIGKQPAPKTGIHNSGWVQDPGQPMSSDTTLFPELEKYVTDVMTHFSRDKRILLWDLYNEPGNSGKKDSSMALLKNVFKWARNVNPEQPISAGLWDWSFEKLNAFQLTNSDIVTYHNYESPEWHLRTIQLLKASGRPLICTEYMARTRNSRFSNILPLLKQQNIGAINWGFVAGKSNTIFAWDTPLPNGGDPDEWFHDIFLPDGKPYRQDEVNLIRKITGVKAKTENK